MKAKVGRPTKYKPEMCARVVELMQEGASRVEVAADLGVSRDTIHQWGQDHPEFSDSLKRGTELSEAWWQTQGRTKLESREFNSTLWYMNMKNRFGWADKQEHKHSGGITLNFTADDEALL